MNTGHECQTTLKLSPRDEFDNPVSLDSVGTANLTDRFSIGLWKRVDQMTKRDELRVDESQLNFVGTISFYVSIMISNDQY